MRLSIGTLISGMLIAGMSLAKDESKDVTVQAKSAIFDMFDKNSLVIEFEKGSAKLSNGEKQDLTALLRGHDAKASTLKLNVAGFSDKNYPGLNSSKDIVLSQADENLAQARIDAVVSYLQNPTKGNKGQSKVSFKEVKKHNLGRKSTVIEQMLATESSQVKNDDRKNSVIRFEEKDEASYMTKILKDKGEPSSVVVVIYDEAKLMSH